MDSILPTKENFRNNVEIKLDEKRVVYFKGRGLSPKESETAALVSIGLTNKEVAKFRGVTEKSVKFHLTNIYAKFGYSCRTKLAVQCAEEMK